MMSPFSSLPYYPSSFLQSSSIHVTNKIKEKPITLKVVQSLEEKRTKKELLTTVKPTETTTTIATTTETSTITSTIPVSSTEIIEVPTNTVPKNMTTKSALQYDSVPSKIEMKMQQINEELRRDQNPNEFYENGLKFETQRPCLDFDPCNSNCFEIKFLFSY